MDLVIDANIVVSAFIRPGNKTSELIFSNRFDFFAPEFMIEEIVKHREEIVEKSGLSGDELGLALSIISSRIKLIPFSEFREFEKRASEICPDPDDVEYFALALQHRCALWSNDKRLKTQDVIKVMSTSEVLMLLENNL